MGSTTRLRSSRVQQAPTVLQPFTAATIIIRRPLTLAAIRPSRWWSLRRRPLRVRHLPPRLLRPPPPPRRRHLRPRLLRPPPPPRRRHLPPRRQRHLLRR